MCSFQALGDLEGMGKAPLRIRVEGVAEGPDNVKTCNGAYRLRGWTGCDFFQSQPLYQSEVDTAKWIWWDSEQSLYVIGNTDGRYGSAGFSTSKTLLHGDWTSGHVSQVGSGVVRVESFIPPPQWIMVQGMGDPHCNGWYCLDEKLGQGKPLYHKGDEPLRSIWYNTKDGYVCGHPDNCFSRIGQSSSANLLGKWREGQVEIV